MKKLFFLLLICLVSLSCKDEPYVKRLEKQVSKQFEAYVEETFNDPDSYEFVDIGLRPNLKLREFDSLTGHITDINSPRLQIEGKFNYELYSAINDSLSEVKKQKGIPSYYYSGYIKYRANSLYGAKKLYTAYIETGGRGLSKVNDDFCYFPNGDDSDPIIVQH